MSFRKPVNKSRGARHFRSQMGRTKAANIAPPPHRGGFRL